MKYKYDLEYSYSTGTVYYSVPDDIRKDKFAVSIKEHVHTYYCDYYVTDGIEYDDRNGKMLSPDETCLMGLYSPISIKELYTRVKEESSSFHISGETFTLKKVNMYNNDNKDSYLLLHGDPQTAIKDSKDLQDKFDDIFKEMLNIKKKN